jgi:hypothetical protein
MPIRDEDGHRAMQAAGKAWKAIKTSGAKTWREWTEVIGPGLVNARAEAQSISNASSGKGYNAAMGALLEEYGFGNALERHRSQVSVISRADPGEPIAGPVARERGRRVAVGVGAYDAPPCVFGAGATRGFVRAFLAVARTVGFPVHPQEMPMNLGPLWSPPPLARCSTVQTRRPPLA